jgi:hypothetical protein
MEQYVGLDVSQKETAICVVDGEGKRVWQGTCRSTPDAMAEIVRKRAPQAAYVCGNSVTFTLRRCTSFLQYSWAAASRASTSSLFSAPFLIASTAPARRTRITSSGVIFRE